MCYDLLRLSLLFDRFVTFCDKSFFLSKCFGTFGIQELTYFYPSSLVPLVYKNLHIIIKMFWYLWYTRTYIFIQVLRYLWNTRTYLFLSKFSGTFGIPELIFGTSGILFWYLWYTRTHIFTKLFWYLWYIKLIILLSYKFSCKAILASGHCWEFSCKGILASGHCWEFS